MERSFSEDIRAEREDLRVAAEQTLNVILDLGLDGRIKWVSPSWRQVVGTAPESVEGVPVADILLYNKNAFHDAVESMKEDDTHSRFIRVAMRMGPDSTLRPSRKPSIQDNQEVSATETTATEASEEGDSSVVNEWDVLNMEAQGIMVYDRSRDGEGHVSVHGHSFAVQANHARQCGCSGHRRPRER